MERGLVPEAHLNRSSHSKPTGLIDPEGRKPLRPESQWREHNFKVSWKCCECKKEEEFDLSEPPIQPMVSQ